MADFTPTQGRYLAFIHAYTELHGNPPSETDIADAMSVSARAVRQMMTRLEQKGFLRRRPEETRSLEILVPEDEIPSWSPDKTASKRRPRKSTSRGSSAPSRRPREPKGGSTNLYVLSVYLQSGPISEKYAGKAVSRVIEIRGDQTLDELHHCIFDAFNRWDQHLYEFQFGERPFDPNGPNYGISHPFDTGKDEHDARTIKLDDLDLKPGRVFGYWFDFGDDWYHQIHVDRVEEPKPKARYPRVAKRVGKSPPQYPDEY